MTASDHRARVAGGIRRLRSLEPHARHLMRCGKELGDRRHGFGEPGLDLWARRCWLAPGMLRFHGYH